MEARVARKSLLLLLGLVLLIRLPFLNQAIQGDDHIYLTEAQHALIDPLHPERREVCLPRRRGGSARALAPSGQCVAAGGLILAVR